MSSLYRFYLECGGVVSTDSRKVCGGELFFALSGDNFDGNCYAQGALDAGARYAVVSDRGVAQGDERFIFVEDTLEALQGLAREHREKLGIKVIGLTGTNGKTTTKELVRVVLGTKFQRIGCTEGNLNNHIGVPLTLLSFKKDVEMGIVEMGANHVGEIQELCEIARPDVGIITNVGRAHLEGFGGEGGIRRAKGELYDFLAKNNGTAMVNSSDATLMEMTAERKGLKTIEYAGNNNEKIPLKLFGSYNQTNAQAAMALGELMGCNSKAMKQALADYTPTNNRSEVVEKTPLNNHLIVDCYNANPSSMEVAIAEFLGNNTDEKIVILGAMKELGEYSTTEHTKLVEMCHGVEQKIFIGEEFNGIIKHFNTVEEATEHITQNPITGKQILIKGSRSNKLEKLINIL